MAVSHKARRCPRSHHLVMTRSALYHNLSCCFVEGCMDGRITQGSQTEERAAVRAVEVDEVHFLFFI